MVGITRTPKKQPAYLKPTNAALAIELDLNPKPIRNTWRACQSLSLSQRMPIPDEFERGIDGRRTAQQPRHIGDGLSERGQVTWREQL